MAPPATIFGPKNWFFDSKMAPISWPENGPPGKCSHYRCPQKRGPESGHKTGDAKLTIFSPNCARDVGFLVTFSFPIGLLSQGFQRQPQSSFEPPLHDPPPARPSSHALPLVLRPRWAGGRLHFQHAGLSPEFQRVPPPQSSIGGRQALLTVLLVRPLKQRIFSQILCRGRDCPLSCLAGGLQQ